MRLAWIIALACASGCDKKPDRDEELAKAQAMATEARKEAELADEKVEKLQKDLDEYGRKLDAAIATLDAAQNDADRAAAKVKLQQLLEEKARLQRGAGPAKLRPAPTRECLDNPLAKGCT